MTSPTNPGDETEPDDLEALLDPEHLNGLADRSIDDVRTLRARCIEVETGLSYLRRMVQGPLDIVNRELARRRDGGEHTDLETLIGELPGILAENTRSGGAGRLSSTLEPTTIDPELAAELDRLVGGGQLGALPDLDDERLRGFAEQLESFERRVSLRRRAFHNRIDELQAELTRRYRTGEASVESLLH